MSQSTAGHSSPWFNQRIRLYPVDVVPGTPPDFKSAAATVLATFHVPQVEGGDSHTPTNPFLLRGVGATAAAAGGAQTTAGVANVKINGGAALADSASTVFTLTSVASHAAGACLFTELNLTPAASALSTPPAYTTVNPGDVITIVVATQGVGAGSQTHYPYIVLTQAPGVTQ